MSNILQFGSAQTLRDSKAFASEIKSIEVVKQALFLLENVQSGVKLTQKGCLPRKLTQSFWEECLKSKGGFYSFKPFREEDCRELHRLNFLLSESGYLKTAKGKMERSEKAETVLGPNDISTLYCDLFMTMVERYNWGYDDRYGFLDVDYQFIQAEAVGILGWIVVKRETSISPHGLFHEIFQVKSLAQSPLSSEESSFINDEPIRCLQTRFFDRFCLPFGLLTAPIENVEQLTGAISLAYAPTPFLLDGLFSLLER